MASSDIIKIGFDYRASLAQFEKDTNGVFDGISNKAGKQKITIQLDAKDDKVIDKIKELQKLKLDKFTFEFGDSGLKEQLQTFDKLENKINEIINIGKEKLFINSSSAVTDVNKITNAVEKLNSVLDKSFNTKNKTEAFKQLKESFKNFNDVDLLDGFNKAGIESGYAFWKSYEEAINKGVAESRLGEFGDIKSNKYQLSKGITDYYKNILLDYKKIESEIAQNNNGIFPSLDNDAIKNINDYVYSLYRIREANNSIKEINHMDSGFFDKELLEESLLDTKRVKEYYEENANRTHKAILSQIQYQNSLKETQEQVAKTVESEKELADIKKDTNLPTDVFNNSQIEILKSDITDVKMELEAVKDRVSTIELNGFEKVREDVEKTKESVKELNSELTNMKTNLPSSQAETNISSGLDSNISKYQEIVSLVKEYYELTSKIKQPTLKHQSRLEDYDRIDGYLLKKAPPKVGTTDIEKDINDRYHKMAKGVNEGNDFAIKAMKSAIQKYWSDVTEMPSDDKLLSSRKVIPYGNKSQKEEYIIPKKYQDMEKSVIQETIAMNKNNIAYEEERKQIEANNSALKERMDLIRNTIKSYDKNPDYNGEYRMGLSLKSSDKGKTDIFSSASSMSQEEMLQEICNMLGVEIPKNADKAKEAIKEVASATATIEPKKDAFPDKDISASVESATNSIKEENNILEQNTQKVKENTQAKEQNANVNFSKYDKRLDSYNGKIDKYKTTINRFNDGGWTSNAYLENVQAVKNAVKEYEDLLKELKGKDASLVTSDDISKLDNYEKKIKDTIATVTNMSASEKGYNFVSGQKELDKIHKLLNENSKMSSEAKAKIKAYYAEIESGNPSMSLDKIHGEILKIYNAEVEAGRAGRTLWDTLKNSGFHQIAAQMAGMVGVYDVINVGKEAISTIVSLDDALVDLKKTTAMNSTQLEQYYYDANDVAKQMGVTTEEIINQSSAWSRLGYNTAEASTEMAKLSSQFASISPGMEVDEAQSGLVSIMKAWSIDPDQVKSEIMDPINQLGNTMAEDNQDIVEGMERSAAALAAVGTSTKDAFALFSGIQEVLQNAEKSGTSLKSVALRLRSFDETTGEYSEDLANITGELIDLTKTAEHVEGVSIFKPGSTTEFKDLTDYFREIAGIWDEMTQKQQNDFLIKAFGRNQAQAGAALIQNFKAVDKALAEMGESAGKFTTRIYSNVYIEYI